MIVRSNDRRRFGTPLVVAKTVAIFLALAVLALAQSTSSIDVTDGDQTIKIVLSRPTSSSPAEPVLLLVTSPGLSPAALSSLRRFANEGFVAAAANYDPEHLADRSDLVGMVNESAIRQNIRAAADRLRKEPGVDANRIGIVAWGIDDDLMRSLALDVGARAAVVLDRSVCRDASAWAVSGGPPILFAIPGCAAPAIAAAKAAFERASPRNETIIVPLGWNPARADARSWLEVTRFLRAQLVVQPVPPSPPVNNGTAISAGPFYAPSSLRIRDLMRVIQSDDGVRGKLAANLSALAGSEGVQTAEVAARWEQARSQAAVLAESFHWLAALPPPRGSLTLWRQRASAFGDAASAVLRAVDQRDIAAAQEAFRTLPRACAACHQDFR